MLDAWPDQVVTTWAGGTKNWHKADWEPLRGKQVSIWADADDDAPPDKPHAESRPGQAAALAIAGVLHSLGCTVRVAIPEPDGGTDIADWLKQGKQYAHSRIADMLTDYAPTAEPEPEPDEEPSYGDKLANNDHYRVLGLDGDYVAIRLGVGRIMRRTRESLTQPATLIAVAPMKWWAALTGGQPLSTSQSRALGDSLIRAADHMGQIDLTNVYGRGAVRLPNGKVVYHLGDRLLVDGQEQQLEKDSYIWLAEPPHILVHARHRSAKARHS